MSCIHSLRKDKYNKNIMKYRVEVEDEDDSEQEDLERISKTSVKAWSYLPRNLKPISLDPLVYLNNILAPNHEKSWSSNAL